MTLAAGQRLGPYEILEPLGAGGMGEVYRATDPRLERHVAIKVLPEAVAGDSRRLRFFEREARAVAALNHPNILAIHDIGLHESIHYVVFELLEGRTLRQCLHEDVRLPVRTVLDAAGQIARGLAAAHAKGIVHRDLKPENLFLTVDGHAKILDFGLVRRDRTGGSEAPGSDLPTASLDMEPGRPVGTASYMSPEQVKGEVADQRSDIFSFGAVLYEILSGRRAFKRPTTAETQVAILHDEVRPLASENPDVPPALAQIVQRCLQKRPEDRFQSIRDLGFALETLSLSADSLGVGASGPGAPAAKGEAHPSPPPTSGSASWSTGADSSFSALRRRANSIVVVPLRDLTPGPDSEHFGDGLTLEIITSLSKIPGLRVISSSSAMRLKGTEKDVVTIGRELSVRYVLEGTIRRSGDTFRVTAQLVDAEDDSQIWAERFDRPWGDAWDVQDRISRAIVEALEVQLGSGGLGSGPRRPIDDPQAYESYLRARQEIWRWTGDALARAFQHLKNALEIVGENELLYAGLGYVHWQYVNSGEGSQEHLSAAETCAHKVFDLAPASPRGHRLLGLIELARGRLQSGVRHLKRTLSMDPNDLDALTWLCITYGWVGRSDAARPLVKKLLQIDPLNPAIHGLPGFHLFVQGDFSGAVDSYRRMYEMEPDNPAHAWFLAKVLAYTDQLDSSFEIIERLEQRLPGHLYTWMCSLFRLGLQGDVEAFRARADSENAAVALQDHAHSWFLAVCHAIAGEKESACTYLENAFARGFSNYPFLSEHDRFLRSLDGEERFQRLMERVRTAWEHFEA